MGGDGVLIAIRKVEGDSPRNKQNKHTVHEWGPGLYLPSLIFFNVGPSAFSEGGLVFKYRLIFFML